MPDPLTLQVMSQIAQKQGAKPARKTTSCASPSQPVKAQPSNIHLTEGHRVLLSDLIHKREQVPSTPTGGSSAPKAGRVSLEEAVRRVKSK